MQNKKKYTGISDLELDINTNESMTLISRSAWNEIVSEEYPALRHEFLESLELSGCCSTNTGWTPKHITVTLNNKIVGLAPCYLKTHSYGEFIFDWDWANAYQRAGLTYYPKLLIGIPFTPISGPRLVHHCDVDEMVIKNKIAKFLPVLADKVDASSVHCLFCDDHDITSLTKSNFLSRESRQFHWINENYTSFTEYLDSFSSKKRKNISRERRRIQDFGVNMEWIHGVNISEEILDFFFACYTQTISEHRSYLYLNKEFFRRLFETMPEFIQILVARRHGQLVASALFLRGSNSLFGRYWGALEYIPDLHFEVCYYAPIKYCIDHKIKRFEAGAQGEHKLSRGLMPSTTLSGHWLKNPAFHEAVKDYTEKEARYLNEYSDVLNEHTPFKRNKS